ncbi:tetratricopeptide repeat protein [Sulfurimonas sp. C5]|uniref:tetratricopeptide repeat protein n=1 Tax=Sulfurimonas sp. C5 TaxID=3036947 RepID=UPI002458B728|nr:tetratricopeptide repeat protein [Sulfurimonas sp. C5]MDH4944787.1 tetratricopeptide repeat protein [Sulfurimonas sp. C5]
MRTLVKLSSIFVLGAVLNAAVPENGLKAEMEGRWNDAINIYEKIVQTSPERTDLYLRLADIYSSQNKLDKAAQTLNKAITVDPKNALLYKKLSEVYAVQNKPAEALNAMESALQLDGNNPKYLMAHAKIANWNKKFAEAVKSLEKLVKMEPKNKEARLLLSRSYDWLGEREKALAFYKNYLKNNPDNLRARLELADIQELFGDINGANKTLEVGYKSLKKAKKPVAQTQTQANVEVPILLYHCVDAVPQNDYWIATDEFDAQMQTLDDNNYTSVSMKDVYNHQNYGTKLPEKPIVITFDDGCKNLYTDVFPILKKHKYIAEVYLITEAIGDSEAERIDNAKGDDATKLGETGENSLTEYLVWPEVKEMADYGIVFGSHTKAHPYMSQVDDANATYQLLSSKLAIVANTNTDVTSFSYPFGDGAAKKELHTLLEKYGFLTAVAAEGGILQSSDADFLNLPRVSIYGVHPAIDPKSKGVSVIPDPTRPEDLFMAKLQPDEAEQKFELCNKYTALGQHDKALEAINRSVELKPKNLRYLVKRLETAGSADKMNIAYDSALRAYELDPDNDERLLALAQTAVWANHLDDATIYYKLYTEKHPENKEAKIEYAQVESWKGAYACAFEILESYKKTFGEDEVYLQTKADILTWANRPTKAFPILNAQLAKDQNNYNTNFTNTVALYKDGQILESLESLEKTEKLAPDSADSKFLRKFITTDLRHYVGAGVAYSYDTDHITTIAGELEGRYFISPLTSVYALGHTDYVSLSNSSPAIYAQDNGSLHAKQNSLRAGVSHRFSPDLTGDFSAGVANAATHTTGVYGASLSYTPIDEMRLSLAYDHHYYTATPKTIGRGTLADSIQATLYAEPTTSMYVDLSGGYSILSDDYYNNRSWNVSLSPTWAVLRRQYWNFDLGLSANLEGYAKESEFYDLGYYAPKWIESYYVTSYTTWKINDDDSVNLAVNLGVFKDNSMSKFVFGGGAHLEGVFGRYRDWMFKVNAGVDYSARYYDTQYTIYSAGLYITRRF